MSMVSSKYNIFDCFIFFLIASLAAGNLFGSLQLPRVVAMLLGIPCLIKMPVFKEVLGDLRIWAVLFLLYSFVSCLWTPAGIDEGLIASVYNLVHFLLFTEIIVFSRFARNPMKAITLGFLVALSATAAIGFWEIMTDNHLSTSKLDEARASGPGIDEAYVRFFAASTFYNLNTYVTFICFILPFLFWGGINKDNSLIIRFFYLLAIVIAIILVLFNGSRGGLLAMAIMALVYFYFSVFKLKQSVFSILLLITLLVVVFSYYGPIILNTLLMRFEIQGAFQEETRFVIWRNALKASSDYLFLGCGAGGMEFAMLKYANGGVSVAHNVFLEVLSEYGIVFTGGLVFYLYMIFKRGRRMMDIPRKMCIYQAIIAFPIIGIINSGYLTGPILWAFLASLYVIANYEHIKSVNKVLCQVT